MFDPVLRVFAENAADHMRDVDVLIFIRRSDIIDFTDLTFVHEQVQSLTQILCGEEVTFVFARPVDGQLLSRHHQHDEFRQDFFRELSNAENVVRAHSYNRQIKRLAVAVNDHIGGGFTGRIWVGGF